MAKEIILCVVIHVYCLEAIYLNSYSLAVHSNVIRELQSILF